MVHYINSPAPIGRDPQLQSVLKYYMYTNRGVATKESVESWCEDDRDMIRLRIYESESGGQRKWSIVYSFLFYSHSIVELVLAG